MSNTLERLIEANENRQKIWEQGNEFSLLYLAITGEPKEPT